MQKCLSAMATIVQSRFAGLMIEDDVPSSVDKSKKTKNQAVKKQEAPKKPKSKPATQQNGTTAGGKKKNKKIVVTEEQWEQWKQKDEEMVDGNFETDLTQAILLSKLDFEEKKDVYKQMRKQAEADKKLAEQAAKEQNKSGKKQKKKNVMSLDQFNDMVSGDDQKRSVDEPPEVPQLNNNDHEFFERVESEAQVELLKDKHKAQVLQRQPTSDQVINRVQFAEALDRKDKEIEALKDEHTRLKEELLLVKSRNKKLCNILGQGEMRDKAEALVEVERLRQVQSELTAEVASLHAQLEQERSRHPDPRSKDKRKKSAIDKEK